LQSETTEVLAARFGPRYRWFATVTVMTGTISAVLTTTTVNVAIPDIMGAFGIGQDRAQWLATGALAAMTVGMLLNAWLINRHGQRRTFIGALIVFICALLVAGMAPNEHVLIACRVVQGLIAGILQPLSMYTLFRVFPPNQRGLAMGFFGMSVILGPALGPTLGGVMIEHFNWRAIFYVAVPVASVGVLLGTIFMPQREDAATRTRFDWVGFALLCTALACLLTGLSNGQREGWNSGFIVSMFIISGLAVLALLVWELNESQPLVDLRVLANGQFTSAATVAWMFGVGLFGSVFLVPLFVQTVQGYTPLDAGLLLMPGGVVLGLFMPFAGFLSDRVPTRGLIMSGLVCFALSSYFLATIDVNSGFWLIAGCVVLSRLGLALIKPSLNVTALRSLRPELLGQGAGMINFARQLGGAFGVNLLSVMLDRRTFFHSDTLTAMQTAGNSGTAELLRQMQALLAQAGVSPDIQGAGAMHFLGRVLYAQAYTMGFRDAFLITAVIFTIGLIPAWIMGRRVAAPARAPQPAMRKA
jgi:MFS transporter, DHA2 family, multidrug resistance protein